MGSAVNDHVELDFVATELDSRDGFGQEVLKIDNLSSPRDAGR